MNSQTYSGKPVVIVVNLSTLTELTYVDITPARAVVNAHAKYDCQDGNAWDYWDKHSHKLVYGHDTVSINDWFAIDIRS